MQQATITFTVRQVSATVSTIAIQGDLSASAENALADAYLQACTARTHSIVLNFTELAYMNSSGIGLLVTLLVRMNRQKQRLLCCGLSEHYRHIFALTRLDEVISIYETEPDALAQASTL
jgi:anti-sigma B factor antagonist